MSSSLTDQPSVFRVCSLCQNIKWLKGNRRPNTVSLQNPADPLQASHDFSWTCFLCSFLSADERQRVGRVCKRLIDGGRLHFLQTRGFDGKLSRYVNSQVTLENVLLSAVPSSASWPGHKQFTLTSVCLFVCLNMISVQIKVFVFSLTADWLLFFKGSAGRTTWSHTQETPEHISHLLHWL